MALGSGTLVAHYRVVSALGAGGMGEVYLAQDTRLNRPVALKVLPAEVAANPERLRRFTQEAQAASAISHPNVAHIYEIGEAGGVHFIAMEYVEGEQLRARIHGRALKAGEILEFASQVVDALDAAHAKGVTHRDIKPANVMITPRGQVKVLDFGLAKVARAAPAATEATLTRAPTDPGVILGTVQYMSPEQALGHEVDPRTDIFSAGVLLYEMATGRLPFAGANPSETIGRILHEQPEPIGRFHYGLPAELERIIRKCLEKDRERRYQSARELLIDLRHLLRASDSGAAAATAVPVRRSRRLVWLAGVVAALVVASAGWWLAARRGPAIDSLAVLPLANATADPNTEYLSDGITESLIQSLSELPQLRVKSLGSVLRYKGKPAEPQTVGRELGVRAVVTGRLQRRGDSLSVSIELVDARDNNHLWGGQFSRSAADVLGLQEEIARETTEKLRLRLSGEERERVARRPTSDNEAFQLYLLGRHHFHRRSTQSLEKAVDYYQQAIARDPRFALAYSGLADANIVLGLHMGLHPAARMAKAREAATRALALDDRLAEAHVSLAHIKSEYDFDWKGAVQAYRRGLELKPGYEMGRYWYAWSLLVSGRPQDAVSELERALAIDPLSYYMNSGAAAMFNYLGRYDQALAYARKALDLGPVAPQPYLDLALAYVGKSMPAEAVAALEKAAALGEREGEPLPDLAAYYAHCGRPAQARKLLDELLERGKRGYTQPFDIAAAYSALGETELAFQWLEKALEDKADLYTLPVSPFFKPIRSDPRFAAMLRRMGL